MFKTIIWATDGSETADQALSYATGLAEGMDKALVVVHIREILAGRGGGYPVYADEGELLEKIEGQVAEIQKAGIAATLKTVTGARFGPGHYVAEIAEKVGADV